MIIERLEKQEDLTTSEKMLAEYILKNMDLACSMKLRDLAEAVFVSPPTVSRLCKKLGVDDFNQFKIILAKECSEINQKIRGIDGNYPFSSMDTPRTISSILSRLAIEQIVATTDQIDLAVLHKVASEIIKRQNIDIYSIGSSAASCEGFVEKMENIGYHVNLIKDVMRMVNRARCNVPMAFSIVVSHSGITPSTLKTIRCLHKNKVSALLITANPYSEMIAYADYVLFTSSKEKLLQTEKIDTFAAQYAIHFILDCIYSVVFSRNFDKNLGKVHHRNCYQFDLSQQFVYDDELDQ